MVYVYEADMAGLIPGKRVWAAGFGVSRSATRITMDLRPCLCELCCWHDEHAEASLRPKGRPARVVVPVLDDNTLDWKNKRVIGRDVDISDSEEKAIDAYARMVESAAKAVQNAQSAVTRTACRIDAAVKYLKKE